MKRNNASKICMSVESIKQRDNWILLHWKQHNKHVISAEGDEFKSNVTDDN